MLPLITTLALSLVATEPPELLPTADPPAPTVEAPEFEAALEHLAQVDTDANHDPVASATALVEALTALSEFAPQLARSPEALELRQLARLNLARAHLLAGDVELATQVMDETVREAMGDVIQADLFGPALRSLHDVRARELEARGRARLIVNCALPCSVYVNERTIDPELPPELLLGPYRIWIDDDRGELPRKRELIELSEAGTDHVVDFLPPIEAPPPPPPPERIMPRPVEIVLTVVGLGLTATGAVLMGLDDSSDYKMMAAGTAALGVGVVTLTGALVSLSVDERRLANVTSRQAMLSWTTSF